MKFRRLFAAILSALMICSCFSFTASAQEAQTISNPLITVQTAKANGRYNADNGALTQTKLYDAVSDTIFYRFTPVASSTATAKLDNHGLPRVTVTNGVCYLAIDLRSNYPVQPFVNVYHTNEVDTSVSNVNGTQGFSIAAANGNEEWERVVVKIERENLKDFNQNHFYIFSTSWTTGANTPADAYVDISAFSYFNDEYSALNYDFSSAVAADGAVTFSIDGEETDVAPESDPEVEGKFFMGWSADENATSDYESLEALTTIPTEDTTYYAILTGAVEDEKAVYISAAGDDSNTGRHSKTPVLTLAKAMELIAGDGIDTLYVVGDVDGTGTPGIASKKIYIKGYSGKGSEVITHTGHWKFGGDVEFSNITLADKENDDGQFMAQGHDIVFNDTVNTVKTQRISQGYYGNFNNIDSTVDINGGSWLLFFGPHSGSTITGKATYNIDGNANISSFRIGKRDGYTFKGESYVNVNGGTVKVAVSHDDAAFEGTHIGLRYFTLNGGTVTSAYTRSGNAKATLEGVSVFEFNEGVTITPETIGASEGASDDSETRVVIFNNGVTAKTVEDTGAYVLDVTGGSVKADVTVASDYSATLNGFTYELDKNYYNAVKVGSVTTMLEDLKTEGVLPVDLFAVGVNNVEFVEVDAEVMTAVYVSDSGDDNNKGNLPTAPVKTLKKVNEILAATETVETVYIVGTVTATAADKSASNHTGFALGTAGREITYLGYTDDDEADVLDAHAISAYLAGDVVMDDFFFQIQTTWDGRFLAEGNDITIGEGMQLGGYTTNPNPYVIGGTSVKLGNYYYRMYGGSNSGVVPTFPLNNTYTIKAGNFASIYMGIVSGEKNFTGRTVLDASGTAKISTVSFTGHGSGNVLNNTAHFTVKVSEGAEITTISTANTSTGNAIGGYKGLREVIVDGGKVGKITTTAAEKSSDGKQTAGFREGIMYIEVNGGTVGEISKPANDENEKTTAVVIFNDGVTPVTYTDSEAYVLNVNGGNVKADITVADDYTTATLNKFKFTTKLDGVRITAGDTASEYDVAELNGEISLDKLTKGAVNEVEFFLKGEPGHVADYRADGYEIVYVGTAAAGNGDGSTPANAAANIVNTSAAHAADEKVVYALVDDYLVTSSTTVAVAEGQKVVITSGDESSLHLGASVYFTANANADILFDYIDIVYGGNYAGGNITPTSINTGDRMICAHANDLTVGANTTFTPAKVGDTVRTGALQFIPFGDGGNYTNTDAATLTFLAGTNLMARSGNYNGSKSTGSVEYIFAGNVNIPSTAIGGHNTPGADDANRTIAGDLLATVKDSATISTLSLNGNFIYNGNAVINVIGGTVDTLNIQCNNNGTKIGKIKGDTVVYYTGGTITAIGAGNDRAGTIRAFVADTDKVTMPTIDAASALTHVVSYNGNNGKVTLDTANNVFAIAPAEGVKYVRITNGTDVKEYNVAGDEVTLMADLSAMTLASGTTTVEFLTEGTEAVNYTVETYTMGLDGQYGEPETETKAAGAGTEATYHAAEKAGFAIAGNSVLSGTVAADGSLVLKVYYERQQYKLYTKADADADAVELATYYYGAAVTAPATPEKDGYTFKGWDAEVPATMPANDVTLTATWEKNAPAVNNKVYLSDGGNDEYDGLSAEKAVKTIAKANEVIAANADVDTLVIVDAFTASVATNNIGVAGRELLTITGNTPNAVFRIDWPQAAHSDNKNTDDYFYLLCPVKFENIALYGDTNDGRIITNGNKVEFGTGVKSAGRAISVAVEGNASDAQIIIHGGEFGRVFPGRFSGGTFTGNSTVVVDGAGTKIGRIGLGHGWHQAQYFSGKLNVTINEGAVEVIGMQAGGTPAEAESGYRGLRYFTLNGGTVGSIVTTSGPVWRANNATNYSAIAYRDGVTVFEFNKAGIITGTIDRGTDIQTKAKADDNATRILIFNNGSYVAEKVLDTGAITANVIGGAIKADVTMEADYTTPLKGYTFVAADEAYDRVTITPATGEAKTYVLSEITAIPATDLVAGVNKVEFFKYVEEPDYTLITPDEVKIVEAPTDETGIPATATYIAADSVTLDSDGNEINKTNAGNYGFAAKYFDSKDNTPVNAVWYKNSGYIPYNTGLAAGTYNVTFRLHLKKNDGGVRGFTTDIDGKKVGTVHVSGTTSTESDSVYTSETYVTFKDVELSENALIKYSVVGGFNDSTIKGGDLLGIYVWQPTPETVTLKFYDGDTLFVEKTVDYGATDDVFPIQSDKGRETAGSNDVFAYPDNANGHFLGWSTDKTADNIVVRETYTATADEEFYAIWEDIDLLTTEEITVTNVVTASDFVVPEGAEKFEHKKVGDAFTGITTIFNADGTEYKAIGTGEKYPGLGGAKTTINSYVGSLDAETATVLFPAGSAMYPIWMKFNDGKVIGAKTSLEGEVNVAFVFNASPSDTTARGFYISAGDVAGTYNMTPANKAEGGSTEFVVTLKTTVEAGDLIAYAAPHNFDNKTVKAAQLEAIYVWKDAPVVTTANATFDADGGAWADGATTKTVETTIGETPVAPAEAPTKAGFTFKGWTPELTAMTAEGATYKAVWEEVVVNNKIYISNSGDDTNDGLTAETPVKTLATANTLLAGDGIDTLVVVGTFTTAKDEDVLGVAGKTITVTGNEAGSVFDIDNNKTTKDDDLVLAGNIIFKNIAIYEGSGDGVIQARGNTVTFAEGITLAKSDWPIEVVGWSGSPTINIASGSYGRVFPGTMSGTYNGGATTINISGGTISNLGLGWGWRGSNTHNGAVYVNVDGGTVKLMTLRSGGDKAANAYRGLRYYTINDGIVESIVTTGGSQFYNNGTVAARTGVTVFEINKADVVTGSIALGTNILTNVPEEDNSERIIIFNNNSYKAGQVTDTGAITVEVRNGAIKADATMANDPDYTTTLNGYTFTTDKAKVNINGTNYNAADLNGVIPADKLVAGYNLVIFTDKDLAPVKWVVGETETEDLAEVGGKLTAPAVTVPAPTKETYYTFEGWTIGEDTVDFETYVVPAEGATLTAVLTAHEMPLEAVKDFESVYAMNSGKEFTSEKVTFEGVDGVKAIYSTNTADHTKFLTFEGWNGWPTNNSVTGNSNFINTGIYKYAAVKYYYVPGTNTEARNIALYAMGVQKESINVMETGKWTYAVFDVSGTAISNQFHLKAANGVNIGTLAANNEVIYVDTLTVYQNAPTVATITFKAEDGATLYAIDAINGEAVAFYGDTPAKDNYTFLGWAIEGTTDVVDSFAFTADTALVPVFEENEPEFPTTAEYKTYGTYDELAGTYTVELKVAGGVFNQGAFGFNFPTEQMTFVSATANEDAGIKFLTGTPVTETDKAGYYAAAWYATEDIDGKADASAQELTLVTFEFTMTPEQRAAFVAANATLTEYVNAQPDDAEAFAKYHNGTNYLVAPHEAGPSIERQAVVYKGHVDEVEENAVEYRTYGTYDAAKGTYSIDVKVIGGKFNLGAFGLAFDSQYMTYDPEDENALVLAEDIANYLGVTLSNTAEGVAFVWDGSKIEGAGYVDATDAEVLIATIKTTMTPAQREAFVLAQMPMSTLAIDNADYFANGNYLVRPYTDGLDTPKVEAVYASHSDDEAEITTAAVTVKVTFAGKTGATASNIGYISVDGAEAVAIDAAGNTEATVEYVINDAVIGDEIELEIFKNGYIGASVNYTVQASANVIEITTIPGDIKGTADALCGDGKVSLDDFVRIIRAFDSAASDDYKASVDLDESGAVNVTDIGLIKTNFGKTTDDVTVVINGQAQ